MFDYGMHTQTKTIVFLLHTVWFVSCCILSVVLVKLIHSKWWTLWPPYYGTSIVGKMNSTIGKIEEFEPEWEDWTTYIECLEHLINTNVIEGDPKKCSVFFVDDWWYASIVLRRETLQPGSIQNCAEPKFHTRLHRASKLVLSYVSELWSIAEYCKFRSTLNLILHDK